MFYVNLCVITKQKLILDTQKYKDKGIKAYYSSKSSIHKRKKRKRKEKEQRNYKTPESNEQFGNSKSMYINKQFKCKQTKFSYQKTQSGQAEKIIRPNHMLLTRHSFQLMRHSGLNMTTIFNANGDQKKAELAILMLDKTDFKPKTVKRNKEVHYIIIKGLIHQEDITFVNIYVLNRGALTYINIK